MTHLRIEQNNGVIEEVSSAVIAKLYDLAHDNTLDNTSNLQGRLHTSVTYREYIEYLTTQYPDLYIITDDYAIPFEDPNMITYLNSIGVGSNRMVTEAQAAAATIVANSANTTVTKFNEFKYFTNVTSSKGGLSGGTSGNMRFCNWTALEEIDISNLVSIGHKSGSGWEDTFRGCSSLTTVKASDKLTDIGWNAFVDCGNLSSITGLSGVITLYTNAFQNCTSLTSDSFANAEITFDSSVNTETCFGGCLSLDEITISDQCTYIPGACFRNCTNLEYINGLTGKITVYGESFRSCQKLKDSSFNNCTIYMDNKSFSFYQCKALTTIPLDSDTVQIGNGCFEGCTSLTTIDLSNITSIGQYAFKNTKLSSVNAPLCTSIGTGVFIDCTSMTTATLGNITSVPNSAFTNCSSLTTITGLSNVTSIGSSAFKECSSLTTIDLGSNVQNVGNTAFYHCGNLNYTWPSSTVNFTDEGNSAFSECSIVFPSTLTISTTAQNTGQRMRYTFNNCDLSNTDVILDSSITAISSYAFFSSHAKSITANYLEVGGDAMFSTVDATEIILPAFRTKHNAYNVQSYYFFSYCPNLRKVVLGHYEDSFPANSTFDKSRAWFNGSVNLKYFDIGDSVPSIHINSKGGNFSQIGSSNTGIDGSLSGNSGTLSLETFVIRNTTVPEIIVDENAGTSYTRMIENFGGSHVKIYVPDASLNDYKTAQYWSVIASNIYPISELPA